MSLRSNIKLLMLEWHLLLHRVPLSPLKDKIFYFAARFRGIVLNSPPIGASSILRETVWSSLGSRRTLPIIKSLPASLSRFLSLALPDHRTCICHTVVAIRTFSSIVHIKIVAYTSFVPGYTAELKNHSKKLVRSEWMALYKKKRQKKLICDQRIRNSNVTSKLNRQKEPDAFSWGKE
jgi:hypothetical protein